VSTVLAFAARFGAGFSAVSTAALLREARLGASLEAVVAVWAVATFLVVADCRLGRFSSMVQWFLGGCFFEKDILKPWKSIN
jgi:hypothetical protein